VPDDTDETPLLDTIAAMTAASLERSNLPADALILARVAALAAVGARPVSYLAHVGVAIDAGVTRDQVEDVLVAVAPIIGTARAVSAAISIAEALGFAIAVAEEALEEALEEAAAEDASD
jgi:alkylhydroperoxidase/carboxymuconolactone decarboxylase family protein YurZ